MVCRGGVARSEGGNELNLYLSSPANLAIGRGSLVRKPFRVWDGSVMLD